jgi:hypothetical protein
LRFLLDTNILIPLQDSLLVLEPSLANFIRLAGVGGHQLLYHSASVRDIERDRNADRRARMLARLRQYSRLQDGPPCPWNTPQTSENDACDNEILYALQRDAVHALVTEDREIHRKARALNLGHRVYYIQAADDWLRRLHDPGTVVLPNIGDVELHTLANELPREFFDSVRQGYPGFDAWFRRVAQTGRSAWVYREADGSLAAICIYAVQSDQRITDDGEVLMGDALKLCTFKVGERVRGRKIGELFLRASFEYASSHRCESIFIHANETRHVQLAELLDDFGFAAVGAYGDDMVYVKQHPTNPPALQMPAFDYVRQFYPHYMSGFHVGKYLVPIQPQFHNILFPDWMDPGHALPQDHPRAHVGNAIKLAYLSHTPTKTVRRGDVVVFIRTRDARAATTIGVVEEFTISTSADQIANLVSRRTVYSDRQIEAMAASGAVKVMLFRVIRHFREPIPVDVLIQRRVVSGRCPQSFMRISDESFSRILDAERR